MCLLLLISAVGVPLIVYFFWRIGGVALVAGFVLLLVGSIWNGWRYRRRVRTMWARNGTSDDGETAR
jgi:hypothetical protein